MRRSRVRNVLGASPACLVPRRRAALASLAKSPAGPRVERGCPLAFCTRSSPSPAPMPEVRFYDSDEASGLSRGPLVLDCVVNLGEMLCVLGADQSVQWPLSVWLWTEEGQTGPECWH